MQAFHRFVKGDVGMKRRYGDKRKKQEKVVNE